ncbi:MAG: hypothetical protein DVB23_001182 [Verrucomicrobia bacterium]|nr:MAG: hypothetical protein DVB23_001182 [Verrucomicrobiota bacterium]
MLLVGRLDLRSDRPRWLPLGAQIQATKKRGDAAMMQNCCFVILIMPSSLHLHNLRDIARQTSVAAFSTLNDGP